MTNEFRRGIIQGLLIARELAALEGTQPAPSISALHAQLEKKIQDGRSEITAIEVSSQARLTQQLKDLQAL